MLFCRCSRRAGFKDKSFARKDGATEESLAVIRPCECEEAGYSGEEQSQGGRLERGCGLQSDDKQVRCSSPFES